VKIGVMMAAYNAAPYIGYALQSILRQRTADIAFDIVVVNDGSTDGTGDIVRSIGAPEIRLIETPNQGVTRARNVALDHMADDIDLFTSLDADDLSPAGRFERDVKHFVHDPGLDFTYGYCELFREQSEGDLAPAPGAKTQVVRGVTIGSGLFRYPFVSAVGRFNAALDQAEDLDFLLRMFELHPRFELLDDICLYVRRHSGNMTRNVDVMNKQRARALALFGMRRRKSDVSLPPDLFDLGALRYEQPL
jgi:glycosyltransferase involved in cell wall biosynthesis